MRQSLPKTQSLISQKYPCESPLNELNQVDQGDPSAQFASVVLSFLGVWGSVEHLSSLWICGVFGVAREQTVLVCACDFLLEMTIWLR